jgi:hypothetical protein
LDIESSASRPDPVKAELRIMLYELFDAALRTSGVSARRRDQFADRGDGLLALIDPADQDLVLNDVIRVLSQLLASYNAGLSHPGDPDRRLRVRVVVHTGNIHDDDNGCFGEPLVHLRWHGTGQRARSLPAVLSVASRTLAYPKSRRPGT